MTTKHRHWDHKFEWTRSEFELWCNEVCQLFNYSVDFDGVGSPPEQHHDLGFCSQFAIFHKLGDLGLESGDARKNGLVDSKSEFVTVAESLHPFLSIKQQKEKQFHSIFSSYIDDLMLACKDALRSVNNQDEDSLSPLQRTFINLRLSNSTSTTYKNKFRKPSAPVSNEQFADSEEPISNGHIATNVYGQERVLAVVEPIKAAYDYLQKLRDSYLYNGNISPTFGQFEDCELEKNKPFPSKHVDPPRDDRLVDLSQFNSELHVSVRLTDCDDSVDNDKLNPIILYRNSELLKISLNLLSELDEVKALELNESELE